MLTLYMARKAGNGIAAKEIICHDEGTHLRLVTPYAGVTTFAVANIGKPLATSIAPTEMEAKSLVLRYYEQEVERLKAACSIYSSAWPGLEEYVARFNKRGFKHVEINAITHDLNPAYQIIIAPSVRNYTLKQTYMTIGTTLKEACESMEALLKEKKKW